jgi:hypothetical protein
MADDADSILPYAGMPHSTGPWTGMRAGRYLVAAMETHLPPRCVLCNAPAIDPPVVVRIQPAASFTYKSLEGLSLTNEGDARVYTCYCPRHMGVRRRALAVAAICAAVGALSAVATLAFRVVQHQMGMGISFMLTAIWFFLMGIAMVVATRGPSRHHVAGRYFYLRGVGRAFLESLPVAGAEAVTGTPIPK